MIESRSFPREFQLVRAPERKEAATFRHLAPPFFWSPWYPIIPLNSAANISIETRSLSQMKAFYNAEVEYFDRRGQRQTVEFGVFGFIKIKAGTIRPPIGQTVKVRFKSSLSNQTILTIARWNTG
jgi:hypothetical protein